MESSAVSVRRGTMAIGGMFKAVLAVAVLLLLQCPILVRAEKPSAKGTMTIKDYGLKNYLHLSKSLPHVEKTAWKLVCTMPYNCHFQQWIEFESAEGKVLSFNSTNPLVLYLTKTETYTAKSGVQRYETQNWVSGEGAIYTIPPGVTVRAVKYRETGYNTDFVGSFECNDNDYNLLWKRAARTAYLCMRDHFYDCPDRERVGFWGDGTPELNQCFYLFDAKSHQLCKDLVLRKLEPDFYPGQHLEFLGEYGLWFYYMHTGDIETLRAVYEQTRTFLLETYQFGKPNQWFDWGKEVKDIPIIETCFYYIDLKTLRKIALLTGHEADIPKIDSKLESIRSTFDSQYWKGDYYQSSRVAAPDDRANAMAINAGLADKAKWNTIYTHVLATTANASCFFDRWVLEALCAIGRQDAALLRMASRYRTMISSRFTTLWEHYDRWWASYINAFDDASSLNHGWNPPVILLSQTIAGIAPEVPGWSVYHVLPKEAFLTKINAVVPSIKGNISVKINKTASKYSLSLISPANTKAIVGIPKGSFTRLDAIRVGEATIWKGAYLGGVEGVEWIGEDDQYLRFSVGTGTWAFVATGKLPIHSPKSLPLPPVRETKLEKRGWKATASVKDGSFLFSGDKIPIDVSAENAIDGDGWTGWRDMSSAQYPGQWFQVDMRSRQTFDKIVLDNTWALWDSPEQYSVSVSNDGQSWGDPIALGKGQLGITTITFPLQVARYLRITQTGSNPTYHWSLYELDVYRTANSKPASKVMMKETISVLDYLKSIDGKRTIAGIHNREPNRRPALQTEKVFALTGQYPGLWSGDFLFRAEDVAARWEMIRECRKQWEAGSLVQLLMHVAPPNMSEVCEWEGGIKSHLSDLQWSDLITEGGALNRAWKARLDEYARYLQYLKDYGVQVLFRPHHEMNQGAFWWGGRRGANGTARLYQITHDYLVKVKGLTNLIWVWDMQDMSRDFTDYNPGEEYWEVFAFDVYGDGYNRSWYEYILPIVGSKPMVIGECDKLPTAAMLKEQPRWSLFMSWAELTFTYNTTQQIVDLYKLPNVITRSHLPKFK